MVLERSELIEEGKRVLPSHVLIDPPKDFKDVGQRRKLLLSRYEEILGKFPRRCDLDHEEVHRRRFSTHMEIKLTYLTEEDDLVHAYLLIPRRSEPPYAGIVAHHQCNIDCDLGKEAVVGKVSVRPDQAYGLELVRRGFVILAPDSKNCGERYVEGVREEGERVPDEGWKHEHCWGSLKKELSTKHFYAKHLYDSIRAIDLLMNLEDLVDPDLIGMIGHSLGAGTTFWTAAYDDRVKVSVASCHYLGGMDERGRPRMYPDTPENDGLWYHEFLELITPRPFLATRGMKEGFQGKFKTLEQNLEAHRWAFSYGAYVYDLYNMVENSIKTCIFDGGHEFPVEVRRESYEFIERALTPS